MDRFKENILKALVSDLQKRSDVLALWEGGSAANGTSDQYSDMDLSVIGSGPIGQIYNEIEATLNRVSSISHKYIEPGTFWPGFFQRIYFLKDSPKHFFVDIGILLKESEQTLTEFLQIERHGDPVVHFDKVGMIKPRKTDFDALKAKQKNRLDEIEAAFPVYRTEVLKELDRQHPIDAYAFYFGGMLKPLVEVMGMIHRPFRYDFGMRYLHKTFPADSQEVIQKLLYVQSVDDLSERALEADRMFRSFAEQARKMLT